MIMILHVRVKKKHMVWK